MFCSQKNCASEATQLIQWVEELNPACAAHARYATQIHEALGMGRDCLLSFEEAKMLGHFRSLSDLLTRDFGTDHPRYKHGRSQVQSHTMTLFFLNLNDEAEYGVPIDLRDSLRLALPWFGRYPSATKEDIKLRFAAEDTPLAAWWVYSAIKRSSHRLTMPTTSTCAAVTTRILQAVEQRHIPRFAYKEDKTR